VDDMMKLVIGWTIVGAFLFTTIITCLSLVGWVKFADAKQQKKLFGALILEVVVGAGAAVAGGVNLDVEGTRKNTQSEALVDVARDILGDAKPSAPVDKERLGMIVNRIQFKPGSQREEQVNALRLEIQKLPTGPIAPDKAKTLRLKLPVAAK
jgi:hypothetical protein